MQLFPDRVVLLANLQELRESHLQSLVLPAQAEHLPVRERNSAPAVGMGNVDRSEHVGVSLKKGWVFPQVARDIVSFHSISPSNTATAGPVIHTAQFRLFSPPVQRIVNCPPRVAT